MKSNNFFINFSVLWQLMWPDTADCGLLSNNRGKSSVVILHSVLNKQKIGVGCIFLAWFMPTALLKGQKKMWLNTKPIGVVTALQSAGHAHWMMSINIPRVLKVQTLCNLQRHTKSKAVNSGRTLSSYIVTLYKVYKSLLLRCTIFYLSILHLHWKKKNLRR